MLVCPFGMSYSTPHSPQRVLSNLANLITNLTQSFTRQIPWTASPTYSTPQSPQRVLSNLATLTT